MKKTGKPVVLVVDDDKNTRDGLQRALQHHYEVKAVESADAALELLAGGLQADVMLSDLRMPGMDGLGLLRRVMAQYPRTVCILLTAYGSVETAVDAMKQGAYDFLTKPINLDHLDLLVARAIKSRDLEKKVETLENQLNEKYGMESIIGESPAMRQVFEIIRQTAPTQASVLIQGASGTGKELVAQAIHRLSPRAKGPFVAVHCAALSPTLLESELFGHERGAFTGATVQRKGRFEMADGGTLFLDEVSEIDPSIQVKLLRVLEERTFERVGGEETIETDIRVIAATNRDLRAYVKEGKFREDLFFRLNVVDILLPSLSERTGDIPLLADRFLKEYTERNNRQIDGFTPDAMGLLTAYAWPGNVRELRNAIEKMVVLSRSDRLSARDVPANIREAVRGSASAATRAPALLSGSLADTERRKIMAVLEKNGGNRTRAAEELGISRRTLHRKLREYKAMSSDVSAEDEAKEDWSHA
ncbi:MAG TPA: sigma-54 dependent transcriptional regulator [Kiritimatiellia bacterium]|jgi:DNA-binding NtrC family response regulator|nr:sigma-54 dependent transcriptional regulator [Candidatus Latescibacterota bacterium]HOM59125.1 sigma-54 dependent transcriptional regulator [Kiritimatiellia bacterium]HOR97934.1 sigma-54 dependent transcriptional regulator [Kiritimatiellia bacterium]HPK37728.1 sigma-54 dependent transcriptional regulator [Kiritimatiellia bacterium]